MAEQLAADHAAEQPVSAPSTPARMYGAVMGVGIACAVAIVVVYEATKPVIERKQVERRNRAILEVLPGAESSAAFRWDREGRFQRAAGEATGDDLVFAGYDRGGQLLGLAIEADGMGYQDIVRVLYGYSFAEQAVVGFRVLQTRETPGLGDRIATDPDFLENFDRLDVRLSDGGGKLAHPIQFVKPGQKRADWQIDGISGATITSQATAAMIGESTAKWIPRACGRRADFEMDESSQ